MQEIRFQKVFEFLYSKTPPHTRQNEDLADKNTLKRSYQKQTKQKWSGCIFYHPVKLQFYACQTFFHQLYFPCKRNKELHLINKNLRVFFDHRVLVKRLRLRFDNGE